VFVSQTPPPSPARAPVSASTASLMRGRRPTATPTSAETESELALRRQLSRLQRQLADAQRELANKDDELAAEVEKRQAVVEDQDALLDEMSVHKRHLDELVQYKARTMGVEQRLQESIATADELATNLELERGKVAAATNRADEISQHFDDARSKWTAERLRLDEQRATETTQLEQQKRAAIEAAEAAMTSATERLRVAHDEELAQLRAAHERSLATMRGELAELEPKALEARSLAEQRERLTSELAAVKTEATRSATERDQAHERTLTQVAEMHAADQTALMQRHAAELSRITGERDEKARALDQATRNAELREQYWESTVTSLREAQKKLQRELAEAKERISALESDKHGLEQRLDAANATATQLADDKHALADRIEAAEAEIKRTALDRARFVAYLEEGMAMLGALPPAAEPPPDPDKT
jgi:chromosome segregation ATPase